MTNYNDGEWHAWNGGECPVPPETMVEVTYVNGGCVEGRAGDRQWSEPLLFLVIRDHREPREWWVLQSASERAIFSLEASARESLRDLPGIAEIIHVREVIE